MSKKRLEAINNKDVFIENTSNTETMKKRRTFSGAMIRLGAYVTYCVIFLLKKLNRLLCKCARVFSSAVTKLFAGVITRLRRAGRKLLSPFIACIKPVRAKFTARRAKTDMEVSSIRATSTRQFISKAISYAVPAAAIVTFAVVLNSTSKIEAGISSYLPGKTEESQVDTIALKSASDELGYAERLVSSRSIGSHQKKVNFEDPVEALERLLNAENLNFIDSYGVYADGEFLGAVANTDDIKSYLKGRLDEIKKQADVTDACYKKNIEYKKGSFAITALSESDSIIEKLKSETTEQRYTIQEGDSLILVAQDHGMTFEELMAINPQITDPDLCYPGTEICVSSHIQFMPVIVTKEIEEKASVPYEIMTVENESLFVGETEILIDGINGESLNTIHVKYEGNTEVGREIVASKIISEPVSAMVSVGTKTRQVDAVPTSTSTVLSGNGKFMWPVNGGYISDTFGGYRSHKGLDIAAPEGTSIFSASDGKVVAAGWNTGGYGYFVMVDHGDGYVTLYAHMSKVIASNGSEVKCGDLLGEVGTTGDSTGNHLHFEVRYNNTCQDPANYICVNSQPSLS